MVLQSGIIFFRLIFSSHLLGKKTVLRLDLGLWSECNILTTWLHIEYGNYICWVYLDQKQTRKFLMNGMKNWIVKHMDYLTVNK